MFRSFRHSYYLPPIEPPKQRLDGGQSHLGIARLWLTGMLLVGGSLTLMDGVAAQKQLAKAHDAGTLVSQPATAAIGGGINSSPAPAKPVQPATVAESKPDTTTPPAPNKHEAKPEPSHRTTQAAPKPFFMSYSEPTAITLPTVGINSDLISVGKTPEGAMEVPAAANFDKAAWYRHSPTPGQFGASVIVGHVDSYANDNGASVFFNLPKLKLDDPIEVKRADGSTATFVVRAVRNYGKAGLPHEIIYAPVTEGAELRLITCSGNFVRSTGSYDSNTVIFATLKQT